jgi:hypothetical protein
MVQRRFNGDRLSGMMMMMMMLQTRRWCSVFERGLCLGQ